MEFLKCLTSINPCQYPDGLVPRCNCVGYSSGAACCRWSQVGDDSFYCSLRRDKKMVKALWRKGLDSTSKSFKLLWTMCHLPCPLLHFFF